MTAPLRIPSLDVVRDYQGSELGSSEWVEISQRRIDDFARATEDARCFHTDPSPAPGSASSGKPFADGFLLLSLVPELVSQLIDLQGWDAAINIGVDRCEFPAQVSPGSRVRLSARLGRARTLPGGGCRLSFDVVVEVEGQDTPGCRARVNYAYFPELPEIA